MITRIITGLILAAITLFAVFWFPTWGFNLFAGIIVSLAAIEWLMLARFDQWFERLCYLVALWLVAWAGYLFPVVLAIIATLWWAFAIISLLTPLRSKAFWRSRVLLLPLGIITLASAWVCGVIIREFSTTLLFYLLILVCVSDTAAYFTGRQFGQHPLAPLISPKKTIEGLVGALFLGTLVSMCVVLFFPLVLGLDYVWWGLISMGLILISICGDLFESLIKRRVNIKDSGSLLPGHGGFLDRVDSLIATLPIYFLVLLAWGYIY